MRWLILALLAGCYAPRGTRCEPCSGIAECPGGLACISGTCQEAAGACEARDDSGTEAMLPDPMFPCHGINNRPFFEVCPKKLQPAPNFELPSVVDTLNGCTYVDMEPGRPETCVIAAPSISASVSTRVQGPRPLVLYARDIFELSGELDLRGLSTDSETKTPAANANLCAESKGGNGTAGGGGPGATFRERGGQGGAGSGAGAAAPSSLVTTNGLELRGGCRGGDGGIGQQGLGASLGGNGGGAIYIVATDITISGRINASGGGARIGQVGNGAGGGGSGGMILLWSKNRMTLAGTAEIYALGGGGGAGGGSVEGIAEPGDDPGGPNDPATESAPNQMSNGGAGGKGGSSSMLAGVMGISDTGGGGGGGGGSAGIIRVIPMTIGTQFGPQPEGD